MENSARFEREVEALSRLFGSQTKMAEAFGVGLTTVSMWKRNGIPATRRLQLLEIAAERDIEVPDWVIPQMKQRTRKVKCVA